MANLSDSENVGLRTMDSSNRQQTRPSEGDQNSEDDQEEVEVVEPKKRKLTFKSVGLVVSAFLGVPEERKPSSYDTTTPKFSNSETKWSNRRYRLAARSYGGLKAPAESEQDQTDGALQNLFPPIKKKTPVTVYAKEGFQRVTKRWQKVGPTVVDDRSISRSFRSQDIRDQSDEKDPITEVIGDGTFFDDKKVPHFDQVDSGSAVQDVGLDRIGRLALADLADNTDRRELGMGVVGKAFQRRFRKSIREQRGVRQQMDELEDYRPYFTYWITFVQILIVILSLVWYGLAPIGIELSLTSDFVLTEKLIYEQVAFYQPSSFWLGPRAADLIHLGAKFSPCMRRDEGIAKAISKRRKEESENSGCCVRNDGSGCLQTTEEKCSKVLSTFNKWAPYQPGPEGRISGPVCGQDPRYCSSPASRIPFVWADDISLWPICLTQEQPEVGAPSHMNCQPTAKPCCIGIHGRCELRSEEYCTFVQGHFHPEATLCSQVSCMQDVCGMLPFMTDRDTPDQFYRMWTSLFLHAGLIHLVITVVVQFFLMRDLERMCGPLRMALIYLGSGIIGNLASAIFVPFRAESGPAGAQFGLLAALVVEVINAWPMLSRPFFALGKLMIAFLVLLLCGFLPWVDNYAHVFGFISGLSLSFILMPYISFNQSGFFYSRKGRIVVIGVSSIFFLSLLTVLLVLFYAIDLPQCEGCKFFSCIPFTNKFCAEQNIDFAINEDFLGF